MNLKALVFRKIFEGKPWYRSMTAWAVVILAGAETVVPLAGEMGLADPEQMAALTSYMQKLAAAMGALGIRRAATRTNGKAIAAVGLVALISLGCNSLSVTTYTEGGEKIKVDASTGGRSCIAANVLPTGEIEVVTSEDASSDWLSLRILPATLQTALVTFFGSRASEPTGIEGPSAIGGCDSIFAIEPE